MAAPLQKNSWIDPSKKAEYVLDEILESTTEESLAEKQVESSVEVELQKAPIVILESDRSESRVLFVTKDASILEKGSMAQLHFLNISEVFNEIHVLILCESWQGKERIERLHTNVWAYTTSVKFWPLQPFAALSLASTQLQFSGGFRPDIVVALDPFESGLCGLLIAEKYDREFQLHITEDFTMPEFRAKSRSNTWRLRIAAHVLKRTQSVRVATEAIKVQITKKYPRITDIALLPRHFDIHAILRASETPVEADAFPQFSFVALFVGKLDHESTLFRAMDACRTILNSPRIGLVVLGEGPNKKEFEKRAEILGIKEQVIFQKDPSLLISYMRSADVLICTDTTEASDEVVIKAAAAGLPILAAKTELRQDLFVDGESALLCHQEDVVSFSQKLVDILNANSLRIQLSRNAQDVIKTRLHDDPNAYKLAYRDTIEVVFSEDGPEAAPQKNAPQQA